MALERKIRIAKEEFGVKVFGIFGEDSGRALHVEYSVNIDGWERSIEAKRAGIRMLMVPSRRPSSVSRPDV